MSYIKIINKLFPMGPDQTSQLLKKFPDNEAQNARMAHVTAIVNDMCNIAHYELDASTSLVASINTNKGIIDISNMDTLGITHSFGNFTVVTLQNTPYLNLNNRDNLYLQLTPYYAPFTGGDEVIPYLMPSGYLDGLNIKVYNANPNTGVDDWKGALYIYYEIKYIA